VAAASGVDYRRIAQIDRRVFGGAPPTEDMGVNKARSLDQMSENIPVTCVPTPNILSAFCVAWAEAWDRTTSSSE
jgi:7-cyano-7-deazaguanine synthase